MPSLFQIPGDISQVAIIVLILAVVWIVIKLVFNLARRVLAAGCFVILVIGLILLATRLFGG